MNFRSILMRLITPLVLAASLVATTVSAGSISFSSGWKNQKLSLFSSNSYSFGGSLGVASDGAVSIAWTRAGRENWDATTAKWSWAVSQSVEATNLRNKGGDDRNLSLYFVFLPDAEAERLADANIRQLLGNKSVRVIQYVWGGAHNRGDRFASPYQPGQGANVILRGAGIGSHSESVNLAKDYANAFGGTPGKLVGIAVSSDSDDTKGSVRGTISNLSVN